MMNNKIFILLLISAAVLMLLSLHMVFFYAPTEKTMGDIQRIFYFHVPCAWISFLAFGITCFGSIRFFIIKDFFWDRLAGSSAGIGFLFCTAALVSGSIWGRFAWGIWWTWDARLTSTLVLWLMFLSYLMLRGYAEDEMKRAYLSSITGIVGFLDVPVVYFSIRWWRGQHPSPVFSSGLHAGIESSMLAVFIICLISFTLLYFALLYIKMAIELTREELYYLQKKYL